MSTAPIVLRRLDTVVYEVGFTREEAVSLLLAHTEIDVVALGMLDDTELAERLEEAVDDDGIYSALGSALENKADHRTAQHSQGDWKATLEGVTNFSLVSI